MSKTSTETRYGSVSITIHWITAILIVALLATGVISDNMVGVDKAVFLRLHMPMGIIILLLTVFRLVWWFRFDVKPKPIESIPNLQEKIGRWTHWILYLLIILMLGSGIALSIMSGLPNTLFGTASMPDFWQFAPRMPHGILAKIFAAFILLHAAAALFHHFVQKDDTLRRMWYKKDE